MKVKKQKRSRRAVRFFSTVFGFREPYKVLLDGTFVHHLLANGIVPADDAVRKLLSARALLFTSKCCVAELRRLGRKFNDAFEAASLLTVARCEHEKVVKPEECIFSILGDNNPEHFFVATVDKGLREKLREKAGVPIVHSRKNTLFLEEPSQFQREFAKLDEEKRMHLPAKELLALCRKASKVDSDADEDGDPEGSEEGLLKKYFQEKKVVGDQSKFKRKRAKGPNPLSCKRKKPKADTSASLDLAEKSEEVAKKKRTRTRKRSRSHNEIKQDTEE